MKLRKEFLIGTIVIIISIAMFYTIRFIQGSNLFSDSITVHASYPKINNLQVGNPIYINGLKVGLITGTTISHEQDAHINVDLTLETKYPIPFDSKAEIMELGLMGSMAMDIILGSSKTILKDGDHIKSSIRTGMIDNVVQKMDPIVNESSLFVAKIDTAITEYTKVAKNLNKIIEDVDIQQKLKRIDDMILSYTQTSYKAQQTLANFHQFGDSLKSLELHNVVENLNTLLVSTDELMERIKTPDGSINKALTQPELYDNVQHTTDALNEFLMDLKNNPDRYIHLSVFGKKTKKSKK